MGSDSDDPENNTEKLTTETQRHGEFFARTTTTPGQSFERWSRVNIGGPAKCALCVSASVRLAQASFLDGCCLGSGYCHAERSCNAGHEDSIVGDLAENDHLLIFEGRGMGQGPQSHLAL